MGKGNAIPGSSSTEGICTVSLEPDQRYEECCSNMCRPQRTGKDLCVGTFVTFLIIGIIVAFFLIIFFVLKDLDISKEEEIEIVEMNFTLGSTETPLASGVRDKSARAEEEVNINAYEHIHDHMHSPGDDHDHGNHVDSHEPHDSDHEDGLPETEPEPDGDNARHDMVHDQHHEHTDGRLSGHMHEGYDHLEGDHQHLPTNSDDANEPVAEPTDDNDKDNRMQNDVEAVAGETGLSADNSHADEEGKTAGTHTTQGGHEKSRKIDEVPNKTLNSSGHQINFQSDPFEVITAPTLSVSWDKPGNQENVELVVGVDSGGSPEDVVGGLDILTSAVTPKWYKEVTSSRTASSEEVPLPQATATSSLELENGHLSLEELDDFSSVLPEDGNSNTLEPLSKKNKKHKEVEPILADQGLAKSLETILPVHEEKKYASSSTSTTITTVLPSTMNSTTKSSSTVVEEELIPVAVVVAEESLSSLSATAGEYPTAETVTYQPETVPTVKETEEETNSSEGKLETLLQDIEIPPTEAADSESESTTQTEAKQSDSMKQSTASDLDSQTESINQTEKSSIERFTDSELLSVMAGGKSLQRECEKRSFSFCDDIVPYKMSSLPNFVGDTTYANRDTSFPYFELFINSSCNPRIKEFICSIVEPKCEASKLVPPCRQFCRAIAEGCKEYILSSLPLSEVFHCQKYPNSDDPDVCINFAKSEECFPQEFQCSDNNTCIPRRWLCDGTEDCPLSSDESDCGKDCGENEFRCEINNKCVPLTWQCDGSKDCLDGSDELGCEKEEVCGDDQFQCDDKSDCIPSRWVCDNTNQCRDNSDEKNCSNVVCHTEDFKCRSGLCIPRIWHCDGNNDCRDNSDEENCKINQGDSECLDGELSCLDGTCIKLSQLCDGIQDCGDETDEIRCDGR